jgi:hypothetical protein
LSWSKHDVRVKVVELKHLVSIGVPVSVLDNRASPCPIFNQQSSVFRALLGSNGKVSRLDKGVLIGYQHHVARSGGTIKEYSISWVFSAAGDELQADHGVRIRSAVGSIRSDLDPIVVKVVWTWLVYTMSANTILHMIVPSSVRLERAKIFHRASKVAKTKYSTPAGLKVVSVCRWPIGHCLQDA